jgi:hypothetical protein
MCEEKRRKLKTQVLQSKTWGTHAPSNFQPEPPVPTEFFDDARKVIIKGRLDATDGAEDE